MQQLQLKAANIKCNGCAATIKARLAAITGVTGVEVKVAEGLVVVEGEALQHAPLAAKLGELGYPVVEE